jgi:molybdate transport system substrate-binding protein
VQISTASSGKHYAQIRQGAPFDVFFSANSDYPQQLEEHKLTAPNSRFTYALGKLVLWSADAQLLDNEASALHQRRFRYLAMANPKVAPYGQAAKQVLDAYQLWEPLQQKIIRGENIGHTFQFVYSGNAQLGFIARSQLMQLNGDNQGSFWPVPQSLYKPIEQQAVLLNDKEGAKAFIAFVKTPPMLEIIQRFGYGTPHVE